MRDFKATRRWAVGCAFSIAAASGAIAGQKLCIYDLIGTNGDQFNMARDYQLAMQKLGVSLELKGYTDERVATEDFRTGQCDAVMATGLRTRQFNGVSAAIDTVGAATILRDGRIDMASSYEVVRKVIQTFADPKAAKLMVEGNFEVAGVLPAGAAYPIVSDRRINSIETLAGKRIAAFDHDKAQAVMIQKIGAQPVSADITTFSTKFNNGSVDMIGAPALAYKPLELYKGVGTKGGVTRFPILMLSYQLIINQSKFPQGYGQKSRQYWADQFGHALELIKKAEATIPANVWMELAPEHSVKYTLMLREARIDIANKGLYDKTGLKVVKRIRCSVNPADSECTTRAELDWN